VLLFLGGIALYLFFATAVGIFLGTVARSMPQLGLLFILIAMPMNILSGTNTPLESTPLAGDDDPRIRGRPLPTPVLSNLLWAAFGINRPQSGDRTAPYWRHVMVIDVYAAMADGVWLYDPKRHSLIQHVRSDIIALQG
jgi:hypothetical protein